MGFGILAVAPGEFWAFISKVHQLTVLQTFAELIDLRFRPIPRANVFILVENLIKITAAQPGAIPLSPHETEKIPELGTKFTSGLSIYKGCSVRHSIWLRNMDINAPSITCFKSNRDRRQPKKG
jgi:hypothetical protein